MTNVVQFPPPGPPFPIGRATLAIECIRCPRYCLSNAASLAEMQARLRNRNWWSSGPISVCPECLDGAACPDCGHDNCDRYWTNVRLRQDPCDCHEIVDFLDRRVARAVVEAGPVLHRSATGLLPDIPSAWTAP